MNGVGFQILARTPVPKLPPSYPGSFSFYQGNVCCVYSFEWPSPGDSNEYIQLTISL